MKCLRGALALAAVSILTALAPSAHATLELKLSDGSTSVDILDNGAGDLNPLLNHVSYIGGFGAFIIDVASGSSTSPASNSALDELHLNSQVNATGSGTLTLELGADGYTPRQLGWLFHTGGTNCAGCSLTVEAYGGSSNTKFDYSPSNQLATVNFTTSGGFSYDTSHSAGAADPFALTLRSILTTPSVGGTMSYDAALDPVPEPSSVALLGGVLLVTAGAIRRKLRRS